MFGTITQRRRQKSKKVKTCGPPFLVGQQKLPKKFWSVSHRFGVKLGQSVGGNFAVTGY